MNEIVFVVVHTHIHSYRGRDRDPARAEASLELVNNCVAYFWGSLEHATCCQLVSAQA